MLDPVLLAAVHRYPIKGFGAQPLQSAQLRIGRGLPFDRFLAIANGHSVVPGTGWTACQTFVRLTQNGDLPLYKLLFDEDSERLTLTAPGGDTAQATWSDPASLAAVNERIASWFPAGRAHAPRLVRRDAGLGWWDYDDAPLSIINLATVRALQARAGQAIDEEQFRGNLLIDGLAAWHELEWLGQRLRIGDAEIEVLRPIERCKATSVDVKTAEVRLNVPALLAGGQGHLYCGVYARVVRCGRVQPGDAVVVRGRAAEATHASAAEPARWPRWATLVRKEHECARVTSYWLRDPLVGLRNPVRAGQHLRVHLSGNGVAPQWRSYTVSSADGDLLRLSVKNEGGPDCVSRRLHEGLAVGDKLLISGPFGSFHLSEPRASEGRPLVLVSAGIGITPTAAMLRALAGRADRSRPVLVLHGARQDGSLALWPEVLALAQALPSGNATLFLSRVRDVRGMPAGARAGRIDANAFAGLPIGDADVFICGPGDFAIDMRRCVLAAGASSTAVHSEMFASPSITRTSTKPAPLPGPFTVRLATSDATLTWDRAQPEAGSILETADAAGVTLPANCRTGMCGACRQTVTSGEFVHLVEPPFPLGPREMLTCSAVPTSDLTLWA
jgi:ferredoxin-NADP reductase/uncharacterized protein YcbX